MIANMSFLLLDLVGFILASLFRSALFDAPSAPFIHRFFTAPESSRASPPGPRRLCPYRRAAFYRYSFSLVDFFRAQIHPLLPQKSPGQPEVKNPVNNHGSRRVYMGRNAKEGFARL
jgi:hypothetical protein